MLIGYGRVSTTEEDAADQVESLVRAGVAAQDIHVDTASGARASRPLSRAPRRAARPALGGGRFVTRCPSCGNEPALARERVRHRHDLAMTWLYPDPRHPGGVLERRHCAACQPHEQVAGVECALCADGPMLAGRLAERGADADPVRAWLAAHGWRDRPGLGLVCARHPRPSRRCGERRLPVVA